MSFVAKTTTAYGGTPPPWVIALATHLDDTNTSQNKIAKALGYSAAAISNVMRNQYPHDTAHLQFAVNAYLNHSLHNAGKVNITNPLHVRMARMAARQHKKNKEIIKNDK